MEKQPEKHECGVDSVKTLRRIYDRGIKGICYDIGLVRTSKGLKLDSGLEAQLRGLLDKYNSLYADRYKRITGKDPEKVYSWEDLLHGSIN